MRGIGIRVRYSLRERERQAETQISELKFRIQNGRRQLQTFDRLLILGER